MALKIREIIKVSLITLGSVALVSNRNNDTIGLRNMSVDGILKNYFNVGIEKSKSIFACKGLCPLHRTPIVYFPKESLFEAGQRVIKNKHLMLKI